MVYVPPGTFLIGQTDQDITYSNAAPNRQVSVSAFYMDETEITNNEYRQFVYWVRDSIAAKVMGGDFVTQSDDGGEYINPDNKVVRSEEHTSELQSLMSISYTVFCLKNNNQVIK